MNTTTLETLQRLNTIADNYRSGRRSPSQYYFDLDCVSKDIYYSGLHRTDDTMAAILNNINDTLASL